MSENQHKPLLQAINLKKYYSAKSGIFSAERLVKALDGVSFELEKEKHSPLLENLGVVNRH